MSRRTLLRGIAGGALATTAMGLLAACGGDDDDDDSANDASSPTSTAGSAAEPTATEQEQSSSAEADPTEAESAATGAEESGGDSGEWSFTDDRGVTITLPSRPERVVAYIPLAASLWDFGIEVVGYFGTSRKSDGSPEIFAGSVDLDAVASVGETYGEIDLEALIALQPDLIVTDMWPTLDLWGLTEEEAARVNDDIAALAGIKFVGEPVTATLASLASLAEALGADMSAPEVAEARERFDQAAADVEAAAAEKPELKTLATAGWTDALYVANPSYWADLLYFQELGLNLVSPDVPDEELWEALSWEQATKYPADLVLNDIRGSALTPEQLAEYPTWNELPAVKAGQVGGWYTEFVPSYAGYAIVLEELAETIRNSRGDVV